MAEKKKKGRRKKAEKGDSWKVKKVFFLFLLHCTAHRILVPRPGTEPMPHSVRIGFLMSELQSPIGGSLIWERQQELMWVGGVMTGGNGKGGRRCNGEIKRKGGYEAEMNERDREGGEN